MRIASNRISDVIRFFKEELDGIYQEDELNTFIAYCFEEFVNIKKADLTMKQNETISESELLKFNFAVKELKQQKPLQYVLGKADFYGLKFIVNENVLIPRPETEELVDLIVKDFNNNKDKGTISILDIGTGSGSIAISIKKNIAHAKVFALDVSEGALSIAKQNAEMNNVSIDFIKGNILDSIDSLQNGRYDVIVSNPPYVCESEKEGMEKNVLDFEPHLALFVKDTNPLLFYNAICDFAKKHLNLNGKIYFEINPIFAEEALGLLEKRGFKRVVVLEDLNKKKRMLSGEI
jgi:release factor glutamine methyltransferase